MAIKKHLKRRVKKVFQVFSSKEGENGRKIGLKKMSIFFKISFKSQSTQKPFCCYEDPVFKSCQHCIQFVC